MKRKGSGVIAAVFVVGITAITALTGGGAGATGHPARPAYVYFREVLCYAPAYQSTPSPLPLPAPPCSPSSLLDLANLKTTPDGHSATGFTMHTPGPDQALAGVHSTSAALDKAKATVLLPARRGVSPQGNGRFVLGPAEMTNRAIASASATKNQTGAWVVDYRTTAAGEAVWDRVAEENFHLVLAIDLDGQVVSAPIIQPTQSSFSSFDGQGEISGNLTRSEAQRLARAL
jgi:hypothetical protein